MTQKRIFFSRRRSSASSATSLSVRYDALGKHEYLLRPRAYVKEERAPRCAVGKVEPHPREPALRLGAGKACLLEIDDMGIIHLDPVHALRQRRAVGPLIEARAEFEDGFDTFGDRLGDEIIDDHPF